MENQVENRTCQNCKENFIIELEDFSFYEKIKVPPPTFCPECRMIRRMCWRNHRSFYKRTCSLCSKSLLSVYKEDGAPVMCGECWMGDNWDPFMYQKEIDLSIPIFNQINELFYIQPRIFQYKLGGTVINCDYSNSVANSKNIYLAFSLVNSEDISFSENVDNSKNSLDCLYCGNIDRCSWNIDCLENYNCHFVIDSNKNIDSYFLYDCSNCSNCCLSTNLRNKSYFFKNKQLSKDEYLEKVKELKLNTFSGFNNARNEFSLIKEKAIFKFAKNLNSVNVKGDHINNSKDINNSFDVFKSENISNTFRVVNTKDLKDCCWVLNGELQYENISGSQDSSNQIGCVVCFNSTNMEHSLNCRNCSDCFGCVGLKNAKYCILNKQYSKEEYLKISPLLRKHMVDLPLKDSMGRVFSYGDFFPYFMCPFGYNETMAHDYFPKTKEQIIDLGLNWKEPEVRNYVPTKNFETLPNSIENVTDDILNDILECPNKGDYKYQCTNAFKLTKEELLFYRQNSLPLPHYCPNCRHYQRLVYRNPMKLYKRLCSNGCGREFETTYAPDRPERVYCESCYQQEVL